jgi:hypothetical protein
MYFVVLALKSGQCFLQSHQATGIIQLDWYDFEASPSNATEAITQIKRQE